MIFKTPSFWYRKKGTPVPIAEVVLSPLSALYEIGYKLNQKTKTPHKKRVPVICIGNITAGGSGKTPTAIAVMKLIRENGIAKNPYFLTRGYGGTHKTPCLLDTHKHTYKDVGDEAFLLSAHAPVVVARNRSAGADLAVQNGADMIIMDDGFQNRSLYKDISIMVVNSTMGLGNGKLLPAGPLREPVTDALKRADLFVLTGDDQTKILPMLKATGKPIIRATIEPDKTLPMPDKDTPVLAFAGLGYPQKFFDFLRNDLGLHVLDTVAFPDHHPYTPTDLDILTQKAKTNRTQLVTTDKDYIRISAKYKKIVTPISIKLNLTNSEVLLNATQRSILHRNTENIVE